MKKLGLVLAMFIAMTSLAKAEEFKDIPTYVWKAKIHASVPKRYSDGTKKELCDYNLEIAIGETITKNCSPVMSNDFAKVTFKLTQSKTNSGCIEFTRTVDYLSVPRGMATDGTNVITDNFTDVFCLKK